MEISVAAARLEADWLGPRVMPPSPEIAAHVAAGGLEIADIDVADRGLFAEAAAAIAWVPSLAVIVATRVAAIHLLRAEPGYDVSHSEPHWEDRIFVSVPDRRDEVGVLRLAESIVHEALHLHLTKLEAISPLVSNRTGKLASPWRSDLRSYGGVLHGAFVFAGLKAYFDIVIAPSRSRAAHHLDQRRAEISQELAELDLVALRDGLTAGGAALLLRLFPVAKVGDR